MRGRKGKEKAHNTKDSGDGGSDHGESLNHVTVKHCLMMNFPNYSDYIQSGQPLLNIIPILLKTQLIVHIEPQACNPS